MPQPYKGGSGLVNRFTITPHQILRNETAAFAGIEFKLRSDNIRITLPFEAEILLDGELCIRNAGVYTIKRYVERMRIRLAQMALGPIEANVGNRAIAWVETGPADIIMEPINPDMLPVAVFGLKSQSIAAGAANNTIDTVATDWLVPMGFEVPECIWVKSVFAWIEGPAGTPPPANVFLYGLRLIKNDSDAAEIWRVLEGNACTSQTACGYHMPFNNAMLPIKSLFEVRAAETPQLRWFWDTSVAPAGGMNVSAGVVASYLRQSQL